MKRFVALLSVLLLAVGCRAPNNQDTQPQQDSIVVYTSFFTMYDFVQQIGGEHVEVHNLMPGGDDAHHWEPTPKDIAALERAHMLVYSGSGFEHWVDGVSASLKNPQLVLVQTSQGLGQEAMAGISDPHVWLSPPLAALQAKNIADALIGLAPQHRQDFEQNLQQYVAQLDKLDQTYRETLTPLPNKTILVSHMAFGYLCREYGLEQLSPVGLGQEGEPDPATLAKTIARAKELGITTVFAETQQSTKLAQTIARELNAQIAVLSPLETLSPVQQQQGDGYLEVMEQNLAALKEALQ